MWTLENRPKYNRDHLRYPSDLTDEEWAYVAPLIPPPKPGGGKRRTDMRAVMNAVMYILSTGCQWGYLPKDFPPFSTVHHGGPRRDQRATYHDEAMVQVRRSDAGDRLRREQRQFLQPEPLSPTRGKNAQLLI